jgi:hypothetical protein
MKHYTLDGKTPLLATDFGEWALWFETANRRVAFTQLKNVSVSTVFLGTDQALLPGDPPLLFETKVFGGQGHGAVVSRIEALLGSMGPRAKMDSMPEGA